MLRKFDVGSRCGGSVSGKRRRIARGAGRWGTHTLTRTQTTLTRTHTLSHTHASACTLASLLKPHTSLPPHFSLSVQTGAVAPEWKGDLGEHGATEVETHTHLCTADGGDAAAEDGSNRAVFLGVMIDFSMTNQCMDCV